MNWKSIVQGLFVVAFVAVLVYFFGMGVVQVLIWSSEHR